VRWESTQQVRQSAELRDAIEISTRRERYLLAERHLRELEAIVSDQRYRLLHSDWRALRSVEFEEFLAQVFRLLGYEVRLTRRTGDHGADLILRHGNIAIAVQAKGYADPVGPDPIREALMGKNMYRCQYCMAITNSRFTSAAYVEANCIGCVLIAGDQMADLILGLMGLPRDRQAIAV
jgi:restriction system protein